jgi:hypothetical protein
VAFSVFYDIFSLSVEEYDELKGIDWEWQMMDGSLVQAPIQGQKFCLEEQGLGRDPTDRGRRGSKIQVKYKYTYTLIKKDTVGCCRDRSECTR